MAAAMPALTRADVLTPRIFSSVKTPAKKICHPHMGRPGAKSWACCRLRHGLEHGDGLHAQSPHLHDLVRAAGPRLCPRPTHMGMANLLRRCFYAAEYTRRQNFCAS